MSEIILGYELMEKIGGGASAEVWRVKHPTMGHTRALKQLKPEHYERPELRRRLEAEARILGRLEHPNIVRVENYCAETLSILMEHVEGRTLKARLAEGALEPDEAWAIFQGILSGVEHAHASGTIHRDLKPANILLTRSGAPKIADFGIAKIQHEESSTLTGHSPIGTPAYMAPEQVTMIPTPDHRADLYALAVIFHELLTGRRPEAGRPLAKHSALGDGVWAALNQALSKDPEARQASVEELREALEAALGGGSTWVPLDDAYAPGEAAVEPRAPRGGHVALSVLSLLLMGLMSYIALSHNPEPPRASTPAPEPTPPRAIASPADEIKRAIAEEEALRQRLAEIEHQKAEAKRQREATFNAELDASWAEYKPLIARGDRYGKRALEAFLGRWAAKDFPNPYGDEALRLFKPKFKAGITWVRLDAGSFEMGSERGSADEKPVHTVTLKAFEMSKTEVTVGQYRVCVAAKECSAPDDKSKDKLCNWGHSSREDHPINCVDWSQATAFAAWANGRLPTEAEWEYAARSQGRTQEYPWGDAESTCERAVMDDGNIGCGQDQTWSVCSKPEGNTAQGLCDMAGNVWEWTGDMYSNNYRSPPRDGTVHLLGSERVKRGGCWYNDGWPDIAWKNLRAANRDFNWSAVSHAYLGFRLARSSP